MMGRIYGALAGIAIVLLAFAAAYWLGHAQGRASCVAATTRATEQAQAKADAITTRTIARASATGAQREAARTRIDAVFTTLETEAAHDDQAPVDAAGCMLPAERLRRWNAANAGAADPGAPAPEPADAAASAAPGSLGADEGSGGQPPPSGPGLPPTGQPAVQPADLPASAAGRVQPLAGAPTTVP